MDSQEQHPAVKETVVSQFVNRHLESVITICICVVGIGSIYGKLTTEMGFLTETLAEVKAEERAGIGSLENRMYQIEKDGTGASMANKWLLDQHAKEIVELKADNRKVVDTLGEIRSDLRMITVWVRQQKGGEIIKPMPVDCE